MHNAVTFDAHNCILGEGPLWHPERGELLWFDILGKQLRTKERVYDFDEYVSAAGWVDHDTLLVASASALFGSICRAVGAKTSCRLRLIMP